jgi:FlaA1/EpsC-like NDP-sugar epimerase
MMDKELKKTFKNKDILVTGGCGSIGSEIVKQLLQYEPKRVRVFDHDESGQFHLGEKLRDYKNVRYLVGDVRDKDRLKVAVHGVDIVFHAAALKHVPLCEYNPFEAISTNVIGTQNLIQVSKEAGVKKFLAISTDKAVNPINTMGATKLLSEKLIMTAEVGETESLFSCVRFGNVLDSDGSVIPIFRRQISEGGPVTVTSKDMTRFFMSMPEAVNLVLKATQKMRGREIFILKMPSLRIIDLAEVIIDELAPKYGYKKGNIEIKLIGSRPGEKLHELLMTEEEARQVEDCGELFVLRHALIAPHPMNEEMGTAGKRMKDYSSKDSNLLKKTEIRELLYKRGIL